MPAIRHLLQRWGFVQLGRFGLELTPEGRILSRRAMVLDDGEGGRVVGWEDADLAVSELRPWDSAGHLLPAVANRTAIPPRPPASRARPSPTQHVIPTALQARPLPP